MKVELNNYYNIDCMQGMQLMLEQGLFVDFLLTDIPYGEVNGGGNTVRDTARENYKNPLRKISKSIADIETFNLQEYLELCDKIVSGNFVIFCGRGQISEISDFFDAKGYTTRLLIWQKNNPSPMNGEFVYLSGIETAIWARKSKATFNANCKNTVLRHNSGINEYHDTQKPLSLWYELLNDLSNKGQTVLDTCAGSCTTGVACHKLKRNFICFEKDKTYWELGNNRLEKFKSQISMFDLMEDE